MRKIAAESGVGMGTILLLFMVILKLGGQVEWSWAIILIPIWVPFALAILFAAIFGAVVIYTIVKNFNH